jgi:hypothetical protein
MGWTRSDGWIEPRRGGRRAELRRKSGADREMAERATRLKTCLRVPNLADILIKAG